MQINVEGGRCVCEESWRGRWWWCWWVGECWGGLFWVLLPAIIRLSLGVSLINAAFLQLTSKVSGIVGTQPLPFAAAPEGGNGRIIRSPRGSFSLCFPFPLFSPSISLLNSLSLILPVCPSICSCLPLICPSSLPTFMISHPHPSLSLCHHFSFSLSPVYLTLLLSFHQRSLIWNAIKSGNNGMCLRTLERERGNRPARGY